MREAAAGEEVYTTYGPLPNVVLLNKHGFVEIPNLNDCVRPQAAWAHARPSSFALSNVLSCAVVCAVVCAVCGRVCVVMVGR
jgi:hypothetical protein